MKGHILGPDTSGQATVISGEDGRRYRFADFEWRHTIPPARGEKVDFEPDGARARDVYRLAPAPEASRKGETPLQALMRHPVVRSLLARPVLTTALLVLLACFATAYAFDSARLSIFAAPDLAWRMSLAIDNLLAGSGPDPGPRLAGAAARIASALLLLLFAVPALAAVVVWRELVGRPDPRLARLAGIAAMALPLALPALVIAIVRFGVMPGLEMPLRLGRDGITAPAAVFHPIPLFASGTFLIMIAGFALWAAASGRLAPWIAAAAQPQRQAETATSTDDGAAGRYVPQWPRPPASRQQGPAEPPPAATNPSARATPQPAAAPADQAHAGIDTDALATLTRRLRSAIAEESGDGRSEPGAFAPERGARPGDPAARQSETSFAFPPIPAERPASRWRGKQTQRPTGNDDTDPG